MGDASDTKWVPFALLGGTVLVLGVNWPLLAIALESMSPMWLTVLRLGGATVTMFIVTGRSRRGLRMPPREDRAVVLSVAYGRLLAVMLLVFMALRLVPPGRSSVLVWTSSLWTVPMAAAFLGERMSARRWVGLGMGILGIVLMVEPWSAGFDGRALLGYLFLLVAAVAQAGVAVHIRGHRWVASPLDLLPWQLLLALVPVTVAAIVIEGIPTIAWSPLLLAIVVYEGTLATSFSTWAQMTVLQALPAITTNLTLMLVPVVGVISSVLVVHEVMTPSAVTATVLIGVGVLVGVGLGPAVTGGGAAPTPLRRRLRL